MPASIQLNVSRCGTVHHDLRNGMMVIMAQVGVLKHKTAPEHHGELQAIKQQITRMEIALGCCSNPNEMEDGCPR